MKALTVRQPWAWLIVVGLKAVENRNWSCYYRGQLLIHAAKGCTFDEWCQAWDWIDDRFPHIRRIYPTPTYTSIPRGGIVGQVDMIGCVDDADNVDKHYFCAWAEPGQYHHLYANSLPLPFRACKGALGLWECHP